MVNDPLKGMPRHGDIYGEPNHGHRANKLWAAVLVYPNGDEGLVSAWTFNAAGSPMGRMSFVTSDPQTLPALKEILSANEPPPGARFEWREYHVT